jgi:hypothetical protein
MRSRPFFVLVSIFVLSVFCSAQRSVTNADLEKYRDQRLRAENDLRENYATLGFPSPDELQRRNEERDKRIDQLTSAYRQQELEETKLALQYDLARAAMRPQVVQQPKEDPFQAGRFSSPEDMGGYGGYGAGYGGYYPGYVDPGFGNFPGNGSGGRRLIFRSGFGNILPQQGYYAGGQFWPTGNRTISRPIVQVRGTRGGGGGGRIR